MRLYTNEELEYLNINLSQHSEEKNVVIERDYVGVIYQRYSRLNMDSNIKPPLYINTDHEKGKSLLFCGPEKEIDFSSYDKAYLKELKGIYIKCHKTEELDLSFLEVCRNLKYFGVHRTNIQELDLSFLVGKPIIALFLTDNRIESLNLSPLKNCNDLKILSLNSNNLKNLDLSPIEKLSNLRSVDLSNNSFSSIDLKIFKNIPLRQLYFHSFVDFKNLDLSPLFSKKDLISLSYSVSSCRENSEGFCDLEKGKDIIYECYWINVGEIDGEKNIRCEWCADASDDSFDICTKPGEESLPQHKIKSTMRITNIILE